MPTTSRTVTTSVATNHVEDRLYCNGNTYHDERTFHDPVVEEIFYKSWERTPNYRALVRANARLPDQPLTHRVHTRHGANSLKTAWTKHSVNSCTGQGGWSINVHDLRREYDSSHVEIVEGTQKLTPYSCIAQLMSRARAAEFQAPVFLVEAKKTVDMVTGLAGDLAESFWHLRRGNVVDAARAIGLPPPRGRQNAIFDRQFGRNPYDAAANRWLEWQYGWKPLLNDAKNAAETLAELQTLPSKGVGRVTARSGMQYREVLPDKVVMVSPEMKARRVVETEESFKAVWRFEPVWGIEAIASLGLTNPLLVAWELVPLSFVVDWFLPIGRYIEQFDNFVRFKHVGGTLGYRRHVMTNYDNFRLDGWQDEGNIQSNSFLTVTRSPFTGVPQLGLESIGFEPKLGTERLLSALALAQQVFRR